MGKNKNLDYVGKQINNMRIIEVFSVDRERSYLKHPIKVYFAICQCVNCGNLKNYSMKYLKEKVLKNHVDKDFYCEYCDNFKESSSYQRVFKKSKRKEGVPNENKDD